MRNLLILIGLLLSSQLIAQHKPTKSEFFDVCDSLGIHNKEVVWSQARLESGNFTSTHFKTRNNCLGIYDSKRKRYASFTSWKECLVAYKMRVQYKCPSDSYTNDQYIDWLINLGYAEDQNYRHKIKALMN